MRIVFDLDGTLADDSHRKHLIEGDHKDWDAYFAACDGDAPLIACQLLVDLVRAGHWIEIWSGRGAGVDLENRLKTMRWLERHCDGITPNVDIKRLRMRGFSDYTPDIELKLGWLNEGRAEGTPPALVFDDRDRVVAMWREQGIPCFQVAPGSF